MAGSAGVAVPALQGVPAARASRPPFPGAASRGAVRGCPLAGQVEDQTQGVAIGLRPSRGPGQARVVSPGVSGNAPAASRREPGSRGAAQRQPTPRLRVRRADPRSILTAISANPTAAMRKPHQPWDTRARHPDVTIAATRRGTACSHRRLEPLSRAAELRILGRRLRFDAGQGGTLFCTEPHLLRAHGSSLLTGLPLAHSILHPSAPFRRVLTTLPEVHVSDDKLIIPLPPAKSSCARHLTSRRAVGGVAVPAGASASADPRAAAGGRRLNRFAESPEANDGAGQGVWRPLWRQPV